MISSSNGRIFSTSNQGVSWFDIGDPAVFGTPGNFSIALAYGAPDPNAPEGIGNLGNFIYVGTHSGQIYVTQDGGGTGTSNNWINISAGLDGSVVESIDPDPTRGSHDAYAVTSSGVFYIANSIPSPSNPSPTWVAITGNIKQLAYSIFGQNYNPITDPNPVTLNQLVSLTSVVADWRYSIPVDPKNPQAGSYPVLYVAGNSGVYQSVDDGKTWTLFPDTTYGAVAEGGDLPHVDVSDLDVSLGNVNKNTGMPTLAGPDQAIVFAANTTSGSPVLSGVGQIAALADGDTVTGAGIPVGTTILTVNTLAQSITLSAKATATGAVTLAAADPAVVADPDLLLATTYGRGQFAIDLAPLIIGNSITVGPTAPGVNGAPPYVGTPITISGTSELSGFGNTTWITVEDVTNPADPMVIAGYDPSKAIPIPTLSNSTNANGGFTFNFDPTKFYTTDGLKTIEVFATDNAGAVGNKVIYTFNFDPATTLKFTAGGEPPATALPGANFATPVPVIVDALDEYGNVATTYNGPVTITLANNATGLGGTETVDAVAGVATFVNLSIADDGTYKLMASSLGLTPDISTKIVIVGAATQLYIVQEPPTPVQAGSLWGFTVGGEDQFGNPTTIFSGKVTVQMGANPGGSNPNGVSSTVTVSGGVAVFSDLTLNKVGQGYTLDVTSNGLTSTTAGPITVVNAAADQLVITPVNEPPTTVTAGQTFGMIVTAEDLYGNVDRGFSGQVSLAISAGGTLTGASPPVTVVGGQADFSNLAIDTAGLFRLMASSTPSLTGVTSTAILVTPAAPNKLVWTTEPPAKVVHNFPFGAVLTLEDVYGNPETNLTASATVMLDQNPGLASLNGTTTVDLLNGVAPFATLSISELGNGYTLQASSDGITSADSSPIDVTPTPAASLVISAQPPTSAQVYSPFGFQVTALDQFGNLDQDFNGNVTVALASGPTNLLEGTMLTVTVAASGGVASFSGLSVDTVGTGYTLAVSSPNLTGATTNPFAILPGNATKLVVTTEPASSVAAGSPFGFVISAEDAYNNIATSFVGTESITVMSGPSGGVLSGADGATAVNGVATASGLILTTATTPSTEYTLQITSPALNGSAFTTQIAVTPLAAQKFVISTEPPSSVVAGSTFVLGVTAEDKYGNTATSFNSSVALALGHNPGTGGLTSTTGSLSAPASNGVVQFTGLALDTVGTPYTISATNGSVTAALSTPITVTPAAGYSLKVTTQPPSLMTADSQFGLNIGVLDQYGNLATGFTGPITIAFASSPGSATLDVFDVASQTLMPVPSITVVPSNGIAQFHAYITTQTAAPGYTLQATAVSAVTGQPISVITNSITVTSAVATKLAMISQPPSLVTPGSPFGFTVAAEDAYGNLATGYTGSFTVSAPGGSARPSVVRLRLFPQTGKSRSAG